jgi:hypothetical protein
VRTQPARQSVQRIRRLAVATVAAAALGAAAYATLEAGYVLAVTTRPGGRQDVSAPLALHRFEILDTTGVAGIRALVERAP